jgi:hypothetical protein
MDPRDGITRLVNGFGMKVAIAPENGSTVDHLDPEIGATWAIIRPFLTMVTFTVIFGKLANLPSEGICITIFSVFANSEG